MGYLDNLTDEQLTLLEEEAERELTDRYWSYALDLVYAWGRYLRTKKLYINALYAETKHKVEGVVNDKTYYKDGIKSVKSIQDDYSNELDDIFIPKFNEQCRGQGVEEVNRIWFGDNLKDGKDTKRLRGKIETRKRNFAKPISLRELV